jgi:TolA-binding protein
MTVIPAKADKLMQNPRATPADHAEANYFKGKAFIQQKNYNGALAAFNKNIELSGDDSRAAESRYWKAFIAYKNRKLDAAMDLCFKVNQESPNHTYWVVKAFILLSDIYAEKDNLFQAKATLQSIVDNYNGDQALLAEAKQKLQNVINAEQGKSKIQGERPSDQMEMIED